MKKMKRTLTALLTLCLAVSLTACSGETTPKEGAQPSPSQNQPTDSASDNQATDTTLKTIYPLKVKDMTGEEFTFEKAPERIVSVSPAETETLFALGLEQKITGVSDYDDYPASVKDKPKMGSIMAPNVESILAAKPDIVFSGISMKEETVKKFRELGVKIFKVEPKTYDDVIANIELYGKITDRQAEAKKVVDELKKTWDEIQAVVKDINQKKKVYIEFAPGWTVGKGEFLNQMIELAGGINVAADTQGWVQINEETIIKQNPDVILYTLGVVDTKTNQSLEDIIRLRKGWSGIEAVKNNTVVGLDQNVISRPGPRLAEGLKTIAKAIYPDKF
ncbi:ABC transporter substrate-binding protein [Brevibacillus laterosporus]|uniref:ABC transporter substrate-binding protein n=1 Tax=Brevibacillus laterosporus TaxID=1465 RepID=A0A518V7L4_BRELA|nr:ABC transporter substrate-binding protein [Brevibacillus laterosporus]